METFDNSLVGYKLSEFNNRYPLLTGTRFKCRSLLSINTSGSGGSGNSTDLSPPVWQRTIPEEMPPSETVTPRQGIPIPINETTSEVVGGTSDADLEAGKLLSTRKSSFQDDASTLNDNPVYNTVTSNASFYQRRTLDLFATMKLMPKDNRRVGNNNFIMVLSALYAKMLIVMGLAFPISEVISPEFTSSSYMAFYIYLYMGSILYLAYVFGTLLRTRAEKTARGYWSRVKSFSTDRTPSNGAETPMIGIKSNMTSQQPSPAPGRSRSNTFGEVQKPKPTQHGSFYLRIGAVAFGVGSMIYSGLEFGQYFEIDANSKCHDIMLAITPAARMLFTFIQMYFIFLNSKMPVNRHRTIAYFGLMHVIATNLCVWLSVIVEETKHEMIHGYFTHGPQHGPGFNGKGLPSFESLRFGAVLPRNNFVGSDALNGTKVGYIDRFTTHPSGFTTGSFDNASLHHRSARGLKKMLENATDDDDIVGAALGDECRRADVMGHLVQDASPFLFPCAIEYSLICAAILYAMWKNTSHSVVVPENDSVFPRRSRHHYSVDCARANKGLFSGLFVLVLTIISLILFFALINREEYKRLAILEVNFSRLIIYTITIVAALFGMMSIRALRFDSTRHMELDDILLVMGQVGVISYNVFTIIAAYNTAEKQENFDTYLILVTALGSIAQACTQSLFILDASRRYTVTKEEYKKKPGREIVTFLLVTNFAMWAINTMEKTRADTNPMQLHFFGPWSWIVITNISMPLAIFYRFHSTVCLCEIWKRCYKVKPDFY